MCVWVGGWVGGCSERSQAIVEVCMGGCSERS